LTADAICAAVTFGTFGAGGGVDVVVVVVPGPAPEVHAAAMRITPAAMPNAEDTLPERLLC
jgi:hypothetical protein